MSRTITALFDSRSDAEAARQRLAQSGIDAGRAQIIDQSTSSSGTSASTSSEGQGFWASLKSAFMPEDDSHAYDEGLRRGGYLLCAQVNEEEADEAIRILDQDGAVDFDRRQEEWRSEGWGGFAGSNRENRDMGSERSGFTDRSRPTAEFGTERSGTVEEERIPLVEEELRIGKREVERGGARVRSYIRETPVTEQVNLREEHVSVERRPVDQRLSTGDLDSNDLLRDRTIEMTETAEEAVVGKQARVKEELVVKKTAQERTEQIDDTVRRTEVDVDEGGRASQDRSAFGFSDSDSGTTGTRPTGHDDRETERQGTGYADRGDKSGF